MHYKLVVTAEMEYLLDECVRYLIEEKKSRKAAVHLLDDVEKMYDILENNLIQGSRLRVASNNSRGWQANKKTHLCVASIIRAMPEKEKLPAMRVVAYYI